MSGTAVVRYKLANSATFIAQVPAARIIVTPQLAATVALPAASIMRVSGSRNLTVGMTSVHPMWTERVQVMLHAASEPSLRALVVLARAALPVSRGTVNGVVVDSILPDIEGPDLSEPDAAIYRQPLDFIVRWLA